MLLQTKHLSKQFNGIYALKDINFSLEEGEIHGLVGENGAGKSTLIKILTGVYTLDEGEILWKGEPVVNNTPVKSRKLGISVIHQDRTLVPTFDGIENAYLGLPYPTKGGRINWKEMRKRVTETAEKYGIDLELNKTAAEMSPPQRTCLEIVRAMMNECRLLILDEPTASLTDKESDLLFDIIFRLKQKGTAILYVTHRMDEIFRLTDCITIFKNGEMVEKVKTSQTDKDSLIAKMTDNWVAESVERKQLTGKTLLKAEHIKSRDGVVKDASLEVHAGEILGVFGLGGSGRTELMECIYGYRPITGGKVIMDGQPVSQMTPEKAIQMGLALISEDRRGKALIGNLSVRENVALSSIGGFSQFGIISDNMEKTAVKEIVSQLDVKMANLEQRSIELSGGNQQKVVFAKTLMTHPKVFLCDEPTQAVDVKTRSEIHRLLREEANNGCGIVFISSDLKEVMEIADRIQIISAGKTREILENDGITSQQVLSCCYAM
ncbi:MAG: sugar ABC transporter ATP-binding protein [Anaerolineaceae bacterium]|nr:sugar ABC transporter ATP-binding protein [Anaerolineaceae bacterium]